MNYDYRKLRGRIKEKFNTQEAFAVAMGMSNGALSARLNNSTGFTQDEIFKACMLLEIPDEKIKAYFFCHYSSENPNTAKEKVSA